MDLNDLATLNRKCTINGIIYRAIQLLDNDFILCVKEEELENEEFPLKTFIIPSSEFK